MEALQEALISSLATVLVALVGVITKKVVAFLNEKGVTEKLNQKQYLVDIAVNAVEQIWQQEEGPVKLEKAKREALSLLNQNGLSVTDVELDNFIEASVKAMNDAINSTKKDVIKIEEVK